MKMLCCSKTLQKNEKDESHTVRKYLQNTSLIQNLYPKYVRNLIDQY